MVRSCLAALLSMCLVTVSASAADNETSVGEAGGGRVATGAERVRARGSMLPVLYGTLAGLQAYDGWSTVRATQRSATEANPVLGGMASNPGAMWAVKTGATMVSIYFAERLWRQHHRVNAVVAMVAVNGMMAAVAAHNASVMRGLK
jgi:hypothetical protein